MRTKAIAAGVVGTIVLLCVAILAITPRPPSPASITVRYIKSVQSGELVTATFEITNHTANGYFVGATIVEVLNDQFWKKCFQFDSTPGPIVGRRTVTSLPRFR
jgi:hypothetical protein